MTLDTAIDAEIAIRLPDERDGADIWRLVRDGGGLDLNSPYSYVLLCSHFRDTCRVAQRGEELVGFVTGYRPPARPNTVFVWQIGVSPQARGQGLGNRLLLDLLEGCPGTRYLEATVTPDNVASRALFGGLARDLGTDCQELSFMPPHLFPVEHAAEILFRIGPFTTPADTTSRRPS